MGEHTDFKPEEDGNDMDMIDDLPFGIFPEAHPESCYQALRMEGLACTRLNAELFYEMNQLGRNRRYGCSTEELREIDLWDLCAETFIWSEPALKLDGQLLSPDACQDNYNRVTRWYPGGALSGKFVRVVPSRAGS